MPQQPDKRGSEFLHQVEAARQRYEARNPESCRLHGLACQSLPGGNTRSVLFYEPFPLTIDHAAGATLWDVDGHHYVDLIGDMTSGLYGHSDPIIHAAIRKALAAGISFGGVNRHEQLLAAELKRRFRSVELVRFTNSGTEASILAIEAARAFSGRERLLVFEGGYHGSVLSFPHSTSTINVPYPVLICPYNDADQAADIMAAHGDSVAAVLVEPMLGAGGCVPGDAAFLQALRALSLHHGSLLIFDEVMTSRLAWGGLQSVHAITPDLTVLGKYLGGGLPFGAVGGRREIMQLFDQRLESCRVHAGTFNNNVLTMAAGVAGLSRVLSADRIHELNARGERLRTRLVSICEASGVDMSFRGIGSVMNAHFGLHGTLDAEAQQQAKELLFFHLLEAGIYTAYRGMVALSLPISDADCDTYVAGVCSFIDRYRQLM